MLRSIIYGLIISLILIVASCNKSTTSPNPHPHLVFKFLFDSTQVRLNGFGQPSVMPNGHAAQSPQMNVMSAHYIELAQNQNTQLGAGVKLYMTPNIIHGTDTAIDFSQEPLTSNEGTVFSVALDSVTPGTYEWLRVSLAYQNYTVNLFYDTSFNYGGYPVNISTYFPSTIASFVGFNTYITSYKVNNQIIPVNGSKPQGYWGFESAGTYNYTYPGGSYPYPYNFLLSGQAPAGATTVVNPINSTSPIPAGSCVATGKFVANKTATSGTPLIITGHETQDVVVTISLSVNKSFEWKEVINDGKWQPSKGEDIVDMGIRGLIPIIGQ